MITVGLVGILGQFKGSHEGIEMLDVYLRAHAKIDSHF